jgi:hypothetical protein
MSVALAAAVAPVGAAGAAADAALWGAGTPAPPLAVAGLVFECLPG